jgi:hypothetical protein
MLKINKQRNLLRKCKLTNELLFRRQDERLKRENKRRKEQQKTIDKVIKDNEYYKEKELEREEIKKKLKKDRYKEIKNQVEQKELERKMKMEEWKTHEKKLSNKQYNYLINEKKYENEIILPELEKV